MVLYVLFESATGYGLFEATETEAIGLQLATVQEAMLDLSRFGKVVKLVAFAPFTSAAMALENANDISEGTINPYLKSFLEMNLPKVKPGKKTKYQLGLFDGKLGQSVQQEMGISCKVSDEVVRELIRGIRTYFEKFIKGLREGDVEKSALGLSHSYSRSKVKFNVNRIDTMVTHSISLIDQMDKNINTFAMRCREWYSYHFPELVKIVNDNYMFARCARLIGHRKNMKEGIVDELEKIVQDSGKAQAIYDASRTSMGQDFADIDMLNVETFAQRVIELSEYRMKLSHYLRTKMNQVAPNLSTLVGEQVGARLISHAGSLTSLAKYPASTVQILGAEKALFRALKSKGNTPKYGLIFHSSFIGKAAQKNKGRISRYLANKCSIASRIDCFSEEPSSKFGASLKTQVEERLAFYETGAAPRKNADVMNETVAAVEKEEKADATAADDDAEGAMEVDTPKKEDKKSKDEVKTPKSEKKNKAKTPKTPKADTGPLDTPKAKKVKTPKSGKKSDKKSKKNKD